MNDPKQRDSEPNSLPRLNSSIGDEKGTREVEAELKCPVPAAPVMRTRTGCFPISQTELADHAQDVDLRSESAGSGGLNRLLSGVRNDCGDSKCTEKKKQR